jgi:hypothetical protein
MFLSGVLFVVFLAGCWLYCLTDAALAPPADFPWLGKRIWIAVMLVLPVLGALAWVIAWLTSRPRRHRGAWSAAEARLRHPSSQAVESPGRGLPIGPDDDDDFLRMLDRFISGGFEPGE